MPGTKELYDKLYAEKLYTNSYQDFVNKYGNDEGQNELYNKLYSNQLYTNDVTSFKTKYFSDLKKKETGASPSMPLEESGSSESQPTVAPGPPVPSVTKVNKPSAYNKNIEASDWQRHQEITKKIQAAAAKKDSAAVIAAANELKSLRSVYGNTMASDKNLSEDLSVTQRIVKRSLPDVDIISATATPSKKEQTLVPKPLVTATGPTKERAKQENELKKFDESLNTSIDMTEDELKYMFLKDNIELGLTEEGQQKLAEKEQQLEEEFSDNEGIWNSTKKLYNKFLTSANSSLYFPMANVGMAGEAKIALAKAAQQLAKEKPDGSATEDEILARAKEIRRQELQSKAGDEIIEEWARNGAPEDKAGITAALTSISSKINVKELEFKRKANELQSVIGELKNIDVKNIGPENASYYNDLAEKGKDLLVDLNENYRYIDNDLNNLSDFNNELDLFKRNYSTLTNLAAKVNVGVFSLAKGFVGLTKMVAPENYDMYWGGGLDAVSTEIENTIKGQEAQVERSKSISDINDINSFMRISGQVLAEQLPQLAVNLYTMGSAKGLAILGASAAGNKYEEIENKEEYTQNQKLLASVAVGLFEVASEKVEANVLKRALPSARVAAAAANGATRLELDAMKAELSAGIKGYTKSAIDKVGSLVLNANQEGVSELIAQVGGNMVDKYVLNNKKTGLLDGVKDAYLTGAIMGGAVTAVPMIAAKVVAPFINDVDGNIRSNNNKIKELSASLEKVTNQESKDIIVESINKLKKDNETIINGGIDVVSNMTPEEIREGVANFEEIQKIKSQFLVIKGDKNLTDAEKKAAMAPLNARYDQLVQRRQEIINKANAIQEQGSGQVPVQPETGTSEKVEQRVPESESKGATEQGQKEEVAKQYVADLQETKGSDPEQYWSVDSVSEEAAKEGTVITDEDGGVVVSKDGDIKGLFKRASSKAKGVAQKLLQKAVEAGGVKLDNFDNYLTPVYEKAGFRVVARVPFNEQYAPEGWNKEKHGTPDVVAMVYDPQGKLKIEEKKFEDYDEAMQYRDSFVNQAKEQVAPKQKPQATTKTKLGQNIKKAIAKVFPDLNVAEFETAKEMKEYVAKKYGKKVAKSFAEDDAARALFIDGKIAEVLVNKELSDETTMPHEIWHGILAKAFGENEKLFKEFRESIDKALRDNGYSDIADALDEFVINPEYIESDTMSNEWLAQLGGMLASAGINPKKLSSEQKSLLQQIKGIVNKFAKAITGQNVFLEDATPENILDFMVGISDSLSRGEDISGYFKAEETVKDTSKIFNSKAQKVGNFEIDYFEDDKDFKKLEEDGYVVQNSSISNIAGEPVAVHQPDSLLVGNVKYKGNQIIDGNGGVYYTLRFGNVWASGKKGSAGGLAKLINKSRKNSSDGKGRLLLVMGSRDKMISSVQGVKASMEVVENLVFDGLIARSDFRKALTAAGKKYNIDFSGSDSSAAIKKDISDKFMNVNDSSFQRRGDFFSDLITEIGKTESAVKNIKEIQKALGATKNISFSKQGVRNQIGVVLSERLTQGVPSGNYYAYIEVEDDVDIVEDKQHESYPWSIVQKNGNRPVLHVLNERLKATDTITKEDGSVASSAQLGLAQMGMGYGVVSKEATTKAQKKAHPYIPEKVFEKLTTDENGDIVFNHYSRVDIDEVRPSTGSGSLITSKEEQQALSSVGGLAMFYTQIGQKETHVGNIQNTVTVDPSKVYYLNEDPLKFYDEAKEQFLDYMNRGENKKRTNFAFSPNYQVAWITKIANENGFDMVISKWRNDYDFRAQTKKTLKTLPENISMKKEDTQEIEVGDKVFLMGREVVMVDKDADGNFTYQSANSSGKINIEEAKRYGRYGNIVLLEKGDHYVDQATGKIVKVTSSPQKSRLNKEIDGVIEKSRNRGASNSVVYSNALNYLQKSKYYEDANDTEREELVRELRSKLSLKEKRNISVNKILGAIKDITKVTVNEYTALKNQIRLQNKAAKGKAKELNDLRKNLSLEVAELAKSGKITTKQAATIIKRLGSINLENPTIVDRFVDYMVNVFENADYAEQLKTANSNINKIKKFYKGKDVQASVYIMAKNFLMLDPKMVDDINEYIAMSVDVMNAVMPTSTPAGVKMRTAADISSVQEYTEREVKSQTKKMRDELLSEYQYLLEAGVLDDTMSYDEIMEIVDSINDEAKPEVLDKGEDVRKYIVKMFNSLSALGKEILSSGVDPVTGESVNLTDDQKALLKKFLNMDIENMSIKEAKLSLEYLSNFITNGITDGIAGLVSSYIGSENLKTFKNTGAKFRKLKLFFSNKLGRLVGEEITNLNILLEQALSGQDRSSLFRSLSGLNKIINGNAAARKQSSDKMAEYVKKFEGVKDFFTLENNVERGILSFLVRTNDSSDELNRRKGLIEQSIAKLMEGNEQEIALGEVAQEIYERIGKDAKTTQDVFDAASKENRDAVNWWINTWGNEYDALKDVSLNIYNADLGKDKNYTPDSYSKIEDETEGDDLGKSAFMLTTQDYTVKKKTGVLMEAKKPSKLSKNRVASFDFDTNNSRAYEAALVDVNTAEAIRVVDGFINSKEFSKLGSAEDARLIRRRINSYIGEIRGKNFVKRSEMSSLNEGLDAIGSIGASMALGSIGQPLKQVIPVAMNTLINTGGLLDIKGAFNIDKNSFIERSGTPIANRGLEAFLNVGTANKYIEEAAKNKGEKAVAFIKKASEQWLDIFLRRPDVFIARASFLSYYTKKLSEMGYDTSSIDWKTHEPVQSALQYAQDMLDRQQNVSDSALMGDMMTSKDPMKQVVKKTVFTFMNFVLNQKARMYSDIITLKSNSSTKSDKIQAGRSLAALSAEMATYSIVGGAISELIQYAVSAIMGVDEDEEARRKRLKSRVETVATNVATDFLSPIPVTNGMVIAGLNKAIDTYYSMTEGETEEEEGDKFRFFEKDKAGLFDNLGAGGIAAAKYMEMFELLGMATTGEFTQEFNGNKKVKFLRDRDKKALQGLSVVNFAYGLGLLPAEAGSIVRSATRVAKKRALSEEDNDTRALYKESNAELPDYLK